MPYKDEYNLNFLGGKYAAFNGTGEDNPAFMGDPSAAQGGQPKGGPGANGHLASVSLPPLSPSKIMQVEEGRWPTTAVPGQQEDGGGSVSGDEKKRQQWNSPVEFLLSCIAMSVGLGNIWRFPFTAYENGGGAFLIPYLLVLFFIGKPLYFLELALGQFSSFGSVKVWKVVPFVKGLGYGQMLGTISVYTYYCSLMALTVYYFFASFASVLPWTVCDPAWNVTCPSTNTENMSHLVWDNTSSDDYYNVTGDNSSNSTSTKAMTSNSENYFLKNVLKFQEGGIDDGIGAPDWRLSLCLLFSWVIIFMVIVKGVQSSGKVAYFTALFPYVVLFTLLIRGVTLDGAANGILYFITPQWGELLKPKVWYAAVSQAFFSLSVGFGPIIMYSSYNDFRHPLHRDALIISLADTGTSFLAGITIFSILGNLAKELGKDVKDVVSSGTGLAFISYPDAIAKFDIVPQLFSVLFFLMLFTLGVGSAVSLVSCIITIICDQFPKWKRWAVTLAMCLSGFLIGLVYITPGGQYVLNLVDYFGGGFLIYIMAIVEVVAISWIYGLRNFCADVEFMLRIKVNWYWKLCWGVIIPVSLIAILIYSIYDMKPLDYNGYMYPSSAYIAGWILTAVAILQLPIWAIHSVYTRKETTWLKKLKSAFHYTSEWGPKDPDLREQWLKNKAK